MICFGDIQYDLRIIEKMPEEENKKKEDDKKEGDEGAEPPKIEK